MGLIANRQFRKGLQHIASFRLDRCVRGKRIQDFLTLDEIDKITYSIAQQSLDFIVANLDKIFYNPEGDNNINLRGIQYEQKQNKIKTKETI